MDLSDVPTPALERFREMLRTGRLRAPVGRFDLSAAGLQSLSSAADQLATLGTEGLLMLLDAVLSERRARPPARVELVWTGPESRTSAARDTAVVVQELFASARRSILIAGFRFDHGATLLAPLHAAMRDRGVTCTVFADRPEADDFIRRQWPFGPPFPEVYVDEQSDLTFSSLHAKCVVADAERVLVTSANFTDRGQRRNVEVGLVVSDAGLARILTQQWMSLVSGGTFSRRSLA
jgi:phosphatidylserine/phosphatidylglycerophosphate/cardiolipin synthase-like enzyme